MVLKLIGEGILATHPVMESGALTIGRGRGCDVAVEHESVSRRHATLSRRGSRLYLEDLGSRNGTRVGQRTLDPNQPVEIAVGELVEIGTLLLVVQPGSADAEQPTKEARHEAFAQEVARRCARGTPFALAQLRIAASVPLRTLEELAASELAVDDRVVAAVAHTMFLLLDGEEVGARERARRVVVRLIERGLLAELGVAVFPQDGRDHAALVAAAGRVLSAHLEQRGELPKSGMERLLAMVDRIGPSDISVMITGETGVGKEVMAERLTAKSRRANRPLLRLNCGALSESLLDSELFGHERGAFTGATQSKPGLLETADGGTVFLDEVGDLPLPLQVKLLRVLEERVVRRVGALKGRSINVRFLAATNRDLESDCAAGRFRRDLYFRLAGITLELPPLRERQSEILPLAESFIAAIAAQNGLVAPRISAEVRTWLVAYHWPGNIRELRNTVERATLLAAVEADATIRREHLALEGGGRAAAVTGGVGASRPVDAPADVQPNAARDELVAALDQFAGNQTRAAKSLGISRQTLIERIKKYGIPRPQGKS